VEITSRPAVRIICLDAESRLLLLRWRDPLDGGLMWEPPGGGIDGDESPIDAARRELQEETGLDPTAIVDRPFTVHRDVIWNGKRFVGPESFFVARYSAARPTISETGLLEDERRDLAGHAWLTPTDLAALSERIEPPSLAAVVAELDPDGPWATHDFQPQP
jgi:8-oxo-dGTP pyrophosphatase MutT (NUDIX family)